MGHRVSQFHRWSCARRPFAALFMVLLSAAACSERQTVVTVHVTPTPGVHLYQVALAHPLRAQDPLVWQDSYLVQRRLDQFSVTLPADASGDLHLRLTGLDQDHCPLAQVASQVPLSAGAQTDVTVSPQTLATPGCLLRVTLAGLGRGSVVIQGDSARCDSPGPCALPLRPTAAQRLRAIPQPGSYFLGWGGACRGAAECQVPIGASETAVFATFLPSQACVVGFCWENPLPQGNRLNAVSVVAPDNAWAVGDNSTILRWNGDFWAPVPGGLPEPRRLRSVWTDPGGDVWVVGDQGTIQRWDGGAFQPVTPPSDAALANPFRQVWGSGPSDVWLTQPAVGFRWDGARFTRSPEDMAMPENAIWGRGRDDVWFAGFSEDGTITHWDGRALAKVPIGAPVSGNPFYSFSGLWGDSRGLWVTGQSLGGSALSSFFRLEGGVVSVSRSQPQRPVSLWGSSPADVWSGDDAGNVLRWNGSEWTGVHRESPPGAHAIRGISGSGPDDVWQVGDGGTLRHWNGAYLTSFLSGETSDIQALWGSAADDLWAGSQGSLLHFAGTSWVPFAGARTLQISAIWGSARDDVWMVSAPGHLLRYDGTGLRTVPLDLSGSGLPAVGIGAIWGSGPKDVWFSAYYLQTNLVLHYDGTAVRWVANVGPELARGLWGSGPRDVWLVGLSQARAPVYHYDGSGWGAALPGFRDSLFSVGGCGANDVWFGGQGKVYHFDGASLITYPAPFFQARQIACVSPREVWFVGQDLGDDRNGIWRWDGAALSPIPFGGTALNAAFATGSDLWVGGANGAILRRRGGP